MDVSGSSHDLVTVAPTARASTAVRRTSLPSATARCGICAPTAVTPGLSSNCVRAVRSLNDRKLITWMRQSIVKLEEVVKTKQAKIDELNARPAPSTECVTYLLSEIELIGRQFESEYSRT